MLLLRTYHNDDLNPVLNFTANVPSHAISHSDQMLSPSILSNNQTFICEHMGQIVGLLLFLSDQGHIFSLYIAEMPLKTEIMLALLSRISETANLMQLPHLTISASPAYNAFFSDFGFEPASNPKLLIQYLKK